MMMKSTSGNMEGNINADIMHIRNVYHPTGQIRMIKFITQQCLNKILEGIKNRNLLTEARFYVSGEDDGSPIRTLYSVFPVDGENSEIGLMNLDTPASYIKPISN